jgi:hypothetical protein
MIPDAKLHNPDPVYLRGLIGNAGLSFRSAAKEIGMSSNGLYNYLRDKKDPLYRPASYPVQFALECLAGCSNSGLDGD